MAPERATKLVERIERAPAIPARRAQRSPPAAPGGSLSDDLRRMPGFGYDAQMTMEETFLKEVEGHIREAQEQIAAQERRVAELERDGHVDAAARARELLATFHETLEVAAEQRKFLLEEIARQAARNGPHRV